VNASEESWRSIMGLLLEMQEPEVSGRSSDPDDLRDDLEQLARGEFDEAEIRKLCDKIVLSPEALKVLARLLRASKNGSPDAETS
jgi:hypothetical protein